MSGRLRPQDIAVTAGLALSAALIGALTLGALSTPVNFKARVAKIEQMSQEVRRLSTAGRQGPAMRPGAVCAIDSGEQAVRVREAIAADAASLNLSVVRMDVGPLERQGPGEPLAGVRIQFEATGGYEAALTLLERLDQLRPQIFADTVDLSSRTSSVTISFAGRAFCAV